MLDARLHSFGWWCQPWFLALLLTLANAAKPVVVDDTAYLLIARHIAAHPTDPYGHELFWYERPEPAMEILAPPVLPYWLALGIRLFGEVEFALKLWLYPFALLLALAARSLLRCGLRRGARWPLPLLVIGPGVLPFFNFMLDIPALALELASIALFWHATTRRSATAWCLLAGLLGGLALQTKYSVLMLPVILMLIAWRRRCVGRGLLTVAIVGLVFIGVEVACCAQQGQSHFLFHLARKAQNPGETAWERIQSRCDDLCGLVNPLLAHSGVMSAPLALLALVFAGVSKRGVRAALAIATLGWLVVVVLPGQYAVLVPGPHPSRDRTTIATVVFITIGLLATLASAWAGIVGAFRRNGRWRRSTTGTILLGWLLIELVGYFVLTPFPAGRRLLGLSWIGSLIAYRLADRLTATWCRGWTLASGLSIALVVMALDSWDAAAEPWVARRAVAIAHEQIGTGRGYGVGHWGFQYALDRAGVALLVPGETQLHAGDWLILPAYPDDIGFYRPYHGGANIQLEHAVEVGEVVWDDRIAAQTVPNLYGGKVPIVARKHPRLRVKVYRVTAAFVPRAAE